jgi:ADP-ribose pyrophosphatase YjhB (NUDIX family)
MAHTPPFHESPIDHYIQANAVQKLFAANTELSFSELKPDTVENSLFMYHMRKLENRGVVLRSSKGFGLTPQGVRWVNFIGSSGLRTQMLPRPLITLLITDSTSKKVLLAKRLGQAAENLNTYLLPGNFHRYGVSVTEAAKAILHDITGKAIEPTCLGTAETLMHLPDGFVHHNLCFVYVVAYDGPVPSASDHYGYEWFLLNDILNGTSHADDPAIMAIAKKYLGAAYSPVETFEFK